MKKATKQLQPMNGYLILKQIKQDKTDAGIFIVRNQDLSQICEVLHNGSSDSIKVGDKVLISRYEPIVYRDEEYEDELVFVKEEDILITLEEE